MSICRSLVEILGFTQSVSQPLFILLSVVKTKVGKEGKITEMLAVVISNFDSKKKVTLVILEITFVIPQILFKGLVKYTQYED